tara:strand:- start:1645 stop:1941 length:297 start_codon:yes stop_codon:yes gene_type:complete
LRPAASAFRRKAAGRIPASLIKSVVVYAVMHYVMCMTKFYPYLDQLISIAEKHEVDLREACLAAGLPSSTYYRWIQHKSHPNEHSARTVFEKITGIDT